MTAIDEPLAAFKASLPAETRAWLDRHPDAEWAFSTFRDQGFEDCWALIRLILPPACAAFECGC